MGYFPSELFIDDMFGIELFDLPLGVGASIVGIVTLTFGIKKPRMVFTGE